MFAGTLHISFIIMQTFLKALAISNAGPFYLVECVSKMKSILSGAIYGSGDETAAVLLPGFAISW